MSMSFQSGEVGWYEAHSVHPGVRSTPQRLCGYPVMQESIAFASQMEGKVI
jgi:hypothetical protein